MEEEKKQDDQTAEEPDVLHLDLKEGVPTEDISSLCMACGEQGVTKFMFTKIPFFKESMISAFSCEHCGTKNSQISFAGKLEDYGVRYEVKVVNAVAFDRQVVKSEFCTIRVPEAGLELPPMTQKGSIKTIEGYFRTTIEGLQQMQEERRAADPATAKKIDEYCEQLAAYADGDKMPFTFIVEDPSGNSFVQNPSAPTADQYCKKTHWIRTKDEYEAMGYPVDQATLQAENDRLRLVDQSQKLPTFSDASTQRRAAKATTKVEQEALLAKAAAHSKPLEEGTLAQAGFVDFSKSIDDQGHRDQLDDDDARKGVMKFPTACSNCEKQGNVQMCFSSIPFFKEIIIMAFICDFCGYRNSEIKEGGGIAGQAKRITVDVSDPAYLNRDVFKSDTAGFSIPEIGFDMGAGTLGSVYTTIEGLLAKLVDELEANNPFGLGDGAADRKFTDFMDRIRELKSGEKPFTLVLDDAAGNCFVYNPHAPEADPKIKVEEYERTAEQNDDLGINFMDVDESSYQVRERTFIMVKPDGTQRGQLGSIISKFEKRGFKLIAMKLCQPGKKQFEYHYWDLKDKKFFPGLIEYAASGPVCCMVWEGDDVVATGRKILGATKPADSNPGTIRGDQCIDVGRNVCHGSDSCESARKEIGLWFCGDDEILDWKDHSKDWVYE